MNKNSLEKYVQETCPKIAEILCEMIPEKWIKIYLYAEIHDYSGTVIFYYYTNKSKKPIYSLDIAKKYNINEKYINRLRYKLYFLFDNLRNQFKNNNQEKWTSATFILENTGKMSLSFNYEPLSETDALEDQLKWEKKYLGL